MKRRFEAIGEYYGAGYYEEPNASPFARFSRGLRRYFEKRELPLYRGEPLYPCGSFKADLCIGLHHSGTMSVDWDALKKKDAIAAAELEKELSAYYTDIPVEHRVAGAMYTHSMPNFHRIVREGLDSYRLRVKAMQNEDLRTGLLDVLDGIACFHARALEFLKQSGAQERLCLALEKVPFKPADTLYEALVCWNFMFYMDDCDGIGRIDANLIELYQGEDVTDVLCCFFQNVDANNGWSGALGPDYNPLTLQCLRACAGIRRPSLELRITRQMPQEIWDAAIDAICAGGGSPSLYNEEAYQTALAAAFPSIPQADLSRFCGGGCTETMLEGMCCVGSLDAGINLALIFERFMRRALPISRSFESFYQDFLLDCHREILHVLDAISETQALRARIQPQPMRTLLIDDCIAKEKDYYDGGARYYWSCVNVAGLINVLDSLLVIKQLVFDRGTMDGATLLSRMDAGERFLLTDPTLIRHGTDEEEANAMAARLSSNICAIFEERTPYSGGKFLPCSIQHISYGPAGQDVGATPDGREAGAPLCDSIGAIHGNDRKGTTALLNSAAALCQGKMLGTPVLNLKLDPKIAKKALRPLAMGYFDKGGMQMQITCISREDLLAAKKHPEQYPNLIVRIAGYSEYFNRLSPELQQTVIDRTYCE